MNYPNPKPFSYCPQAQAVRVQKCAVCRMNRAVLTLKGRTWFHCSHPLPRDCKGRVA